MPPPPARHLSAEVQAGALASLAAHAARVGQLAEARAVAQSTLVTVASACHAHAEHLHLSLVAPKGRHGKNTERNGIRTLQLSGFTQSMSIILLFSRPCYDMLGIETALFFVMRQYF